MKYKLRHAIMACASVIVAALPNSSQATSESNIQNFLKDYGSTMIEALQDIKPRDKSWSEFIPEMSILTEFLQDVYRDPENADDMVLPLLWQQPIIYRLMGPADDSVHRWYDDFMQRIGDFTNLSIRRAEPGEGPNFTILITHDHIELLNNSYNRDYLSNLMSDYAGFFARAEERRRKGTNWVDTHIQLVNGKRDHFKARAYLAAASMKKPSTASIKRHIMLWTLRGLTGQKSPALRADFPTLSNENLDQYHLSDISEADQALLHALYTVPSVFTIHPAEWWFQMLDVMYQYLHQRESSQIGQDRI